ncbi:hypothetical protein NAC44_20830 [Allorhizobium sp. BGMRC 0089]|uniref:hypothetical protein n=1 Tax=Allorhizobium sonneratiae TaxID=2934936 RepID=UPI0020337BE6|nr:hypothetical protein [Allorhizobium sonneratiae]MCM2294775.1 hypothetical protein [Allorhizobium sonneratiae]
MAFVTRFTIERLTEDYGTEYYMSPDQWSEDREDAEEFYTAAKAQRRADRVGGEVFKHCRPSVNHEAYMDQVRAETKAKIAANMAAHRHNFLEAAE